MFLRLIMYLVPFTLMFGANVAMNRHQLGIITPENVTDLQLITSIDASHEEIHRLEFSSDGNWLGFDTNFQNDEGQVTIWNIDEEYIAVELEGSLQGFIDNEYVDVCQHNSNRILYNLETGEITSNGEIDWCGTLSPSSNVIASAENYYLHLNLHDALNGRLLTSSTVPASCLTFSSDGEFLATSADRNPIVIWKISNLLVEDRFSFDDAMVILPHNGVELGYKNCLAFSNTSELLVYSSLEGIFVWDIVEQRVITEVGDNLRANAMTFSSDDSLLFLGNRSLNNVTVWDTVSWQQIAELPEQWVSSMAMSPSGRLLAVDGEDQTITIWGVAVSE